MVEKITVDLFQKWNEFKLTGNIDHKVLMCTNNNNNKKDGFLLLFDSLPFVK